MFLQTMPTFSKFSKTAGGVWNSALRKIAGTLRIVMQWSRNFKCFQMNHY